jgi:hypothetical protein
LSLQLAAVKRKKEKLCSDAGQEKEASVLLLIKARKRRKYLSTVLFAIKDRFLDIIIFCAKRGMQNVILMHGNTG